jgi:hypothetical protein
MYLLYRGDLVSLGFLERRERMEILVRQENQ